MGLLRRKDRELDLGPASLLPAGDPGCWLVRATTSTASTTPPAAPSTVRLPVEVPAQEVAPEVVDVDRAPEPIAAAAFEAPLEPAVTDAAASAAPPAPRPARARLAALSANLSV